MKKILYLIFVVISMSSCAVNQKIKYNDLSLNLFDIKTKKIDLALLDHREGIIDGSRKPTFVGYMRSGSGIAFPMETQSKNNFIDDLANNIVNSLKKQGIEVMNLNTKWENDEKTIKSKLLSLDGNKKIFFVFNKLNTDGYMIQFLHYKINLYVYDKNGILLKSKIIEGKEKLGGNIAFGPGSYKKYMPIAVSKLFENIFNDTEIIELINKN